ncbi:hypothetical protein ACIPSE_12985 [Streptomyces sp. NPDC090106]|uniref:hypothetical protein n=1 Tax=Streptomyces sp. NPDC090106 TaxID=3365946 RepID=UPI003809D66E
MLAAAGCPQDEDGIAARHRTLEDSGLPHVTAAAARLARFDRDAQYAYTVQAATSLVLDQVRASTADTGEREGAPDGRGA